MEIISQIKDLGLTHSQAKVYLALLELDQAPVSTIAKKAEIKRPTCYLVLDELENNKLIDKIPIAGKIYYKAKSPNAIVKIARDKLALAKELAPILNSFTSSDPFAPKVKLYEGKSGIIDLYTEFLRRAIRTKSKEILWLGDLEQIEKVTPGILGKYKSTFAKNKIFSREIVIDSPYAREIINKTSHQFNEYRTVPNTIKIEVDLGIIDSEVIVVAQKAPLFGLSIEHRGVAQSYRSFFELAWIGVKK